LNIYVSFTFDAKPPFIKLISLDGQEGTVVGLLEVTGDGGITTVQVLFLMQSTDDIQEYGWPSFGIIGNA